ncbi:MAG: CYTH domain-containing protein [Prevotellaceae bacterium]|jgi:adenylate cyclase|nr:CYTH domain-containing protein [Prevotellaceae bacterium]
MGQETERKFLVKGDFRSFIFKSTRIVQGYLSSAPERTVRIRIKGDKGFLTIKGIGNDTGASRFEFEKEITVEEAGELLKICEPGVIDKVRHLVKAEPYTYEIDEFHGENEGLIVAEIELPDENAIFYKPEWLGAEVTGDKRYYNSMLMKNPFTKW